MNASDDATSIDGKTYAARAADDTDELLVARARARDAAAFELLMRRHNQRIYRVVRSVLRDSAEIEDVIQQAYVQAFLHLDQFGGDARWSTWVCRIAINEALARLRQRGRFVSIEALSEDAMADVSKGTTTDPERATAGREFGHLVEQAIDHLPDIYRSVLIMREVEGMSTSEAAAVLDVEPEVIKTRLHRARAALRAAIEDRVGEQMKDTYTFGNERCDRVVAAVLARLNLGV
ncbi:MAG TPA: RNA polymerase sigma factor [Polyangia bacterium]|jgi:RNA polymerase sigma-70 factor (ECF subfamily)